MLEAICPSRKISIISLPKAKVELRDMEKLMTFQVGARFVSFVSPGLFVGLHLKPSHGKDADIVTDITEASAQLHLSFVIVFLYSPM